MKPTARIAARVYLRDFFIWSLYRMRNGKIEHEKSVMIEVTVTKYATPTNTSAEAHLPTPVHDAETGLHRARTATVVMKPPQKDKKMMK